MLETKFSGKISSLHFAHIFSLSWFTLIFSTRLTKQNKRSHFFRVTGCFDILPYKLHWRSCKRGLNSFLILQYLLSRVQNGFLMVAIMENDHTFLPILRRPISFLFCFSDLVVFKLLLRISTC